MHNTTQPKEVALKLIEFFETDKMRRFYMIIGNIFFIINLIFAAIVFFYGLIVACLKGSIIDLVTLSNLGQFYSGTVIAFLTLATISLISLAYVNQRIEIKHLKELNEIQDGQIKDSKLSQKFERFEKTFFKMVDLYNLTVHSMKFDSKEQTKDGIEIVKNFSGREVFKKLYEQLTLNLGKYKNSGNFDNQKIINFGYTEFDSIHEDLIGNYYRIVFIIFKTIDDHVKSEIITPEQSKYYIEIIRSQFSDYELLLLFYDGLSKYGGDGFKGFLTNFSFFRYLDISKVYNCLDLNLYPQKAYEK